MTRKHLEAIASVIRARLTIAIADASEMSELEDEREHDDAVEALRALARAMADELATLVERFDRARFLRACGVTE